MGKRGVSYFTGALNTSKMAAKNESCPGLMDAFFFTVWCLGTAFWTRFFFCIYPVKHTDKKLVKMALLRSNRENRIVVGQLKTPLVFSLVEVREVGKYLNYGIAASKN